MNPYDFLRPLTEWMLGDAGRRVLGFVLTSTQPARGDLGSQRDAPVGFARGVLRVHHGGDEHHVTGDADQLFSDRTTAAGAPFDPNRRDRIQVNVYSRESNRSVRVELVLLTWGGGRTDLANLRIQNGVVLGDGPSVGQQTRNALYALSLAARTG